MSKWNKFFGRKQGKGKSGRQRLSVTEFVIGNNQRRRYEVTVRAGIYRIALA